VPAHVFPATIIKKWERDPNVANDNHTADLDGDHVPDVAIGRIPADTPEEAKLMLGKVIAYEGFERGADWQRRINVIAGVGGFGAAQDAAIEMASTAFLKESIPAGYELHVTYCNPKSSFCPPPSKVMEFTSERFNEGALFVTYIGHGWRNGFDRCKFKGISYRIFTEDAAAELECREGLPIAFLLCCSTGHFDGAPDCIAEVMIKQPKGPVAVISSSRVSMPYGNAPFAKELLEACLVDRKATLGEAFLQAKQRSAAEAKDDLQRVQIDFLARITYEPDVAKLRQERIEHLYLYNLLGDPSMLLPHPKVIKIEVEQEGDVVLVKLPDKQVRTIELVAERQPNRGRRTGDTDEEFQAAYEKANAFVVAERLVVVLSGEDGPITIRLQIPKDVRAGKYHVRVWGNGEMGWAKIKIKR